MNQLNNIMADVMTSIEYEVAKRDQDGHCETCNEIADKFGLWQDDNCFPTWLSYLVAGVMRECGKSS